MILSRHSGIGRIRAGCRCDDLSSWCDVAWGIRRWKPQYPSKSTRRCCIRSVDRCDVLPSGRSYLRAYEYGVQVLAIGREDGDEGGGPASRESRQLSTIRVGHDVA